MAASGAFGPCRVCAAIVGNPDAISAYWRLKSNVDTGNFEAVQLAGAGFELLATQGDSVAAGGPVVEWDAARIEAGGRSPVCPVVALDAAPEALSRLTADGVVPVGAELFGWC